MSTAVRAPATTPPRWRTVALPREHGGWGLTLEPVLLGLLVSWSTAGALIGAAAFGTFLVRTPLKTAAVDLRRRQWRPRSALAVRIAAAELVVVMGAAATATILAGARWLVPVLVAVPLVGVATWYDVRSRSRRLVPELCGATGMAAVVASIVLAGGGDVTLGVALWVLLTARSIGAIVFVRTQITRRRRPGAPVGRSDLAQIAAVTVAGLAVAVDARVLAGALVVVLAGCAHALQARRPLRPVALLGVQQMVLGLILVVATALGVVVA